MQNVFAKIDEKLMEIIEKFISVSNLVMTVDVTSEFREIKNAIFTQIVRLFEKKYIRWENVHGQITSEHSFSNDEFLTIRW